MQNYERTKGGWTVSLAGPEADVFGPLLQEVEGRLKGPTLFDLDPSSGNYGSHYVIQRRVGVVPYRSVTQPIDGPCGKTHRAEVPFPGKTVGDAYKAIRNIRDLINEKVRPYWNHSNGGHLVTMVYSPISVTADETLFAEFEVQWVHPGDLEKVLARSKTVSEHGAYPINLGSQILLGRLLGADRAIQAARPEPPPEQSQHGVISLEELRVLQARDRQQREEILKLNEELFNLREKIRVEPFKAFMEAEPPPA